jgi:hypothetical protein
VKNIAIDELNTRMAGRYGKSLSGQPLFRVIWSNDATEKRHGNYAVFQGPLMIGSVTETRDARKYNYIQDRWLLERFLERHLQPTIQLPEPNGYECIYVFEDSKGNPLPVIWGAIELIIYTIMNPTMDSTQLKQAIEDAHLSDISKEESYFEQRLSDSSTYFQHKLHHGETILLPGKDFKM